MINNGWKINWICRISNATTHVFPKTNFFEPILLGVIERRFSDTGLLVKDLLLNEYFLDKQFAFLKHLFLFDDDLIFPVYKNIFNQVSCTVINSLIFQLIAIFRQTLQINTVQTMFGWHCNSTTYFRTSTQIFILKLPYKWSNLLCM